MNKLHLVILGIILCMIMSKLMKSKTEKLTIMPPNSIFSKSLKARTKNNSNTPEVGVT